MTKHSQFNLSEFLVDSLCLNGNTTSPARPMFPQKDPYSRFSEEDPIKILGEVNFKEAKEVPEEEVGTPIQEFFRGVNVFITGGSGFLGKVLTEKLLRAVPHIGHVYLLIRPKRGKSCQDRLELLMEDRLFLRMKTEKPQYRSKITALAGDLSEPGLGLRDEDRQLLQESVHVVFHCAADVNFLEPLRKAITINVLGSIKVMDLARDMKNLKAYVHVSTAYSHCVNKVIEERIPKMYVNYKDILSYVETNSDNHIEANLKRTLQGWPNTYTFSKALCEDMIQEEAKGLPICVFRPSIVTPSYREPVRGWTDNLNGPSGFFLSIVVGFMHIYRANGHLSSDCVPVDYVVNCMIALAWDTAVRRGRYCVPVCCNYTSAQNLSTYNIALKNCLPVVNNWPPCMSVWYPSLMTTNSVLWCRIYSFFLHTIPGHIIDNIAHVLGKKPRMTKTYNKVSTMYNVIQYFIYKFWDFKHENATNLWNSLTTEDKKLFHFDIRDVNWTEYSYVSWLGIKYYYLKESMESIPAAKRKLKWLRVAHYSLKIAFGFVVLKLAVHIAHVLPI